MILVDFQQIMIANLMMGTKGGSEVTDLSEALLRHMALNTIRAINMKFKREFGKMVICCDNRSNWRKTVFPYYKAMRKKSRDESPLDWGMIYASFEKIKDEMAEFMPYVVVDVQGAEADDVIGVLTRHTTGTEEKVLIVSSDRDFIQLHFNNSRISQWDHVNKKWVSGDPRHAVLEKIIRGDSGDGVPNFLSPDDCLVTKTRQKAIMSVKVEAWLQQDPSEFCTTDVLKANYERNKKMVDLSSTPSDIATEILDKYTRPMTTRDQATITEYFVHFGLRKLMSDVQDFV